jgi:hypothetical protein
MQQSASAIAIGTLESGLAGTSGLLTTRWKWYSLASIGVGLEVIYYSLAFAIADFATAIFLNNLLNFSSASAVLPSRETVPFNSLVRFDASFMTNVLGVTCGFVIYWCLKNTMLLTLIALIFTM